MGLQESAHKTQNVVKTFADKRYLDENRPSWVLQEATILGVSITTGTSKRKATDNELKRIQKAKRRAGLLLLAPVTWNLKVRALQSMVLSMAAYGWIGQNPILQMGDALFNSLTNSLSSGKGASRFLRLMFYGGATYLPWVVVQRRWGRLKRRIRSEVPWNGKPFTSVHMVRQGLKNLGFQSVSPWVWKPKPEFSAGVSGWRF